MVNTAPQERWCFLRPILLHSGILSGLTLHRFLHIVTTTEYSCVQPPCHVQKTLFSSITSGSYSLAALASVMISQPRRREGMISISYLEPNTLQSAILGRLTYVDFCIHSHLLQKHDLMKTDYCASL